MTEFLVALALRAFPRRFRRRFGEEIRERALEDCREHAAGGRLGGALEITRTLLDLVIAGLSERLHPTWFGQGAHHESDGRMRMGIQGWISDLRHAVRTLARSPGFTTAAVATLALALGINAAIFAVVDRVLLEPLPIHDPDRVVVIAASAPGSEFPDEFPVSNEFYIQYREQADLLESLATFNGFTATLRVGERVERVGMAWPSWSFFEVMGVEPLLGRWPVPEDGEDVMVLAHSTWVNWFGSDPDVLGQTHFAINGPKEIIGVMPPEFTFPDDRTHLWASAVTTAEDVQVGRFGVQLVGRMVDGADHDALREQLAVLARRLPERFGGSAGYAELIQQHVPVVRSVEEQFLGPISTALWVLMGAVGLVLLIACANVANLFAVRTETRGRALAVRRALGAGRAVLMRAQMAEALVISLIAGVGAVAIASLTLPILIGAAPDQLPRISEVRLDGSTLGFTVIATVVTALLCGLVPALRGSRPALGRLRDGGRGSTRRRNWGRNALVAGQTALALVLLIGSGLLMRSFGALMDVDPGYTTEDIFSFQFAPEQDHLIDGPSWAAFHMEFMDRLRALPGVESVGIVENLPLNEGTRGTRLASREMAAENPEEGLLSNLTFAGGDYFSAMEIEVLRGRPFEPADIGSANVVLGSRTAEALFGADDPIGRQVSPLDVDAWFTVVGVVEDVLQSDFRTPPQNLIYLPMAGPDPEAWGLSSPGYVIRTARAETIAPEVRALVREVAPEAPMYRTFTMAGLAEDSVMQLSFTMMTLAVAAALALLLGAVGLYGILSYVVAERSQEIGVRMALGAEAARVRRMVVVEGARVVGVGVVLGLGAAFLATRGLESLLFGVAAIDPVTFGGMALAMVAIGVIASWVPAHRASSVDPLQSMRG